MIKRKLLLGMVLMSAISVVVPTAYGAEIVLSYDRAGQLASIDYPGRNYIRYRYDNGGNLLEVRRVAAIDWKAGDVVRDGVLDLLDVVAALQVLVSTPTPEVSVSADIDADGRIGKAEVIYLLDTLAGLSL